MSPARSRLEQLRVRHMRFLDLLSATGSLAAVAERLSMSPSAASMMLKEIESLFGTKLFRRQGRGMAPTPQGQALMPRCRTMLGEVGALHETLAQAPAPLLRIGAFPHTTTTVLPALVKKLLDAQPPWRVQIFAESGERLLAMLHDGDIDLLLGQLPRPALGARAVDGLAQRVLYQGSLSVVAGQRHPLASRRSVPLVELLDWPWVLPTMQSTTRVALSEAFLRRGLAPPVPQVESPSFFYSLSLLAQTDLLTCCATTAALNSGHQTAVLPVEIGVDPTPVALVWRRSSPEAARAAALLD